jgi:homeobox-leucine zipper protein
LLFADLRKIDVNSFPSTVNCEEDTGVSSPNSTISSTISGKRSEREGISGTGVGSGDDHDEITPDRGYSRGTSDEEEDGGETSRKKLRLSKDQSAFLEETFKEHNTLNPVSVKKSEESNDNYRNYFEITKVIIIIYRNRS